MIALGNHMQEKITGFKGIATARAEYLTGCVQILVEPQYGRPGRGEWIDELRLEITATDLFDLKESIVKEAPAGPQNSPKRTTPPC